MKGSILTAYLGLFICFALSFFTEPVRLEATEESPLPAVTTQAPTPEPKISPQSREYITVRHGEELMEMELEEYITGVLAAEMPADFEPEALKAQTVAARSYTFYCAGADKHGQAHVCTDYACCQAWKSEGEMRADWGDAFEDKYGKIREAVSATAGEYLSYEGEPVFAAFHSSSAGKTERCGAIWSELPYLVSVDSPESAMTVPNFESRVELSPLDFRDTLLHAEPGADFSGDEREWIDEICLEESGRVDYAVLGGCEFPGTKLRSLFSLRSTAFSLEYSGGVFVFSVRGYGHGVGMSQYGAQLMAQQGSDYTEILAHYYPGTMLVE